MAKMSAGLLMYRMMEGKPQVLLVHPGGPFWAKKDLGAWSIPKGLCDPDEDLLSAARREFTEETGLDANGGFSPLGEIRQPSGKLIHAWAFEGNCDPEDIRSNTFTMVWPPRSGISQEFPEVDGAGWFNLEDARQKILKGQAGFIDRLEKHLKNIPPCKP